MRRAFLELKSGKPNLNRSAHVPSDRFSTHFARVGPTVPTKIIFSTSRIPNPCLIPSQIGLNLRGSRYHTLHVNGPSLDYFGRGGPDQGRPERNWDVHEKVRRSEFSEHPCRAFVLQFARIANLIFGMGASVFCRRELRGGWLLDQLV
jgi:hypothetical protein